MKDADGDVRVPWGKGRHRGLPLQKGWITLFLIAIMILVASCKNESQEQQQVTELKILATRKYVETLGELTRAEFEKKHKCTVRFRVTENAGSILDTLRNEKDRPKADIVVGLGNVYREMILADSVLTPFVPVRESAVPVKHRIDKEGYLTPYQYAYVGFIYDTMTTPNPPKTFGQITDHDWKDSFILPDPFCTNVGKGFYRLTAAFGNVYGFPKIWRSMKPNVKMLTDTEEEAYNRFMAGEARIAMVELTRFAKLYADGDTGRYKLFSLQEGNYQIYECAGVVKGASHPDLAKRYIEFMMSKSFQERIPTHSWNFPIHEKVDLPESFKVVEVPVKEFSGKWGSDPNMTEEYLRRKWEKEWRD